MGGTFSDLEFITYDHWMPEEDPTFYVPASLTLTGSQRAQLQDSGFHQGEPFVLTKDGALTKPASKKFALRGMKSSFSIRKGSLQLFEESPGNFSLEFYYYTDEAVILEIHLNAVDASSSKYIKLKQSELRWGPYKLHPSNQPHTATSTTSSTHITHSTTFDSAHRADDEEKPSQPEHILNGCTTDTDTNTSDNSTTHRNGNHVVDVTELDDLECKPIAHTLPATSSTTNATPNTNSDTICYTHWSSRKLQHKHLSAPLPQVTTAHLPSLCATPLLTTGVYDVVLIVTTASHVAAATSARATGTHTTSIHNTRTTHTAPNKITTTTSKHALHTSNIANTTNIASHKPNNTTYKTHASWLTRRALQKVIPVRTNSLCGDSSSVVNSTDAVDTNISSNTNTNTNNINSTANTTSTTTHQYCSVPAIDLAENPHSEEYQISNSSPDVEPIHNNNNHITTIANSNTTVAIDTTTNRNTTNSTHHKPHTLNISTHNKTTHTDNLLNCVQREAFYYRVNIESYNKRHLTNANSTIPTKQSTLNGSAKRKKSVQIADDKNINTSLSMSADSVIYSIGSSTSNDTGDANNLNDTTVTLPASVPINTSTNYRGIFMRSKGVTFDLAMQLFQVQSGVYNRITLYGMEGFMAPKSTISRSISGSGDSSESVVSTDAEAKPRRNSNATPHSTTTQHAPFSNTTNTSTHATPTTTNTADTEIGAECSICLTNKQTTIMFPCRHLCLCGECAATVATRANISNNMSPAQRESAQEKKCPVCRKPVIVMFQLKA